jgi:hypothetical protein
VVAVSAGRHGEAFTAFDTAVAQFERLGGAATVDLGHSRLYRALALAELDRAAEARTERKHAEALLGDAVVPDLAWVRERLAALLDA